MTNFLASAPLTTLIAVYAAVVSTLVFVWNLRKDFKDRGKMAIAVSLQMQIAVGQNILTKLPKRTLIRVVNQGRRACTLRAIGLVRRPSMFGWSMRLLFHLARNRTNELSLGGLPKRLEYEELWSGEVDWKSFYLTPYGQKVAFYAEDTLGRRAFTGRLNVDDFKDPDFEDESELPYTVDEKYRAELNRHRPK